MKVSEELAQIPVRVELASEFRYREMPLVKDGLVIVISQSGETASIQQSLKLLFSLYQVIDHISQGKTP